MQNKFRLSYSGKEVNDWQNFLTFPSSSPGRSFRPANYEWLQTCTLGHSVSMAVISVSICCGLPAVPASRTAYRVPTIPMMQRTMAARRFWLFSMFPISFLCALQQLFYDFSNRKAKQESKKFGGKVHQKIKAQGRPVIYGNPVFRKKGQRAESQI